MRTAAGWCAALVALASGAMASGAEAHVIVQPTEAPADSYAQLTFVVPHGCAGSATIALRLRVPEGVLSAKPQMKPGWSVEIKTKDLAQPVAGPHGHSISKAVEEIIWRGGPLPDDLFDSFGLIVRLPDRPGQRLAFPVVQECEHGVANWTEVPAEGRKAEYPAPAVRLKAGAH